MEIKELNLETFIRKFEEQFEAEDPGSMTARTQFRELGEWSSMHALIVTASFDWEYGVTLNDAELRTAVTLLDLFQIVKEKMG